MIDAVNSADERRKTLQKRNWKNGMLQYTDTDIKYNDQEYLHSINFVKATIKLPKPLYQLSRFINF